MRARSCWNWIFGLGLAISLPDAGAGAASPDFEREIAPLLARRCLNCHNSATHQGHLDLTREGTLRAGGDSGAALVPGDANASLLWERIASDEMPPKKPLDDAEKKLLRAWIDNGAHWGASDIDPLRYSSDQRAGYDWWSLQPIKPQSPPEVQSGQRVKNEIDQFLLARLESAGLTYAPEADSRTLIRRLWFDLTGLPPTSADLTEWTRRLATTDTAAREAEYAQLVDQLLASPHYGERWARHWLDVVRFGESQGYERNRVRENAWRYRDWVIQAFNRDLPYDEFLRQQIAGDVLYPGDVEALIATGYHVCGTWDQVGHSEGSQEMRTAARQDHLEDLVGTLAQSFLGLTVQCARCHDHKFDPIPQRDYYRLAAALAGVTQQEKEREQLPLPNETSLATPSLRNFTGVAHALIPQQPPIMHVLQRGDFRKPGEVVVPAGLSVLADSGAGSDFGLPADAPEGTRRAALAQWITSPAQPLTPRVMVNRLWHYHFGRGIVDTPSDFGFAGGRPTHPELLDWLSARFVATGWRVKDLHRLIVTSAAYRQASVVRNPTAEAVDADNRLLWRAHARRLEGEELRDAMLLVSSALNTAAGGPSYRDVKLVRGKGNNDEFTDPTGEFGPEVNRRTIYRLWARSGNNPLLESLDCPDPSVAVPRRPQTITPVQSLALFNGRFVEQCAAQFAEQVRTESGNQPGHDVDQIWAEAFGRPPTPLERAAAVDFVKQRGLAELCLVIFNTNEFAFVE